MGQNQTKATKFASKPPATKLNRHLLGSASTLKSEKTGQLHLILQKCKEHPASGAIIGCGEACPGTVEKTKAKTLPTTKHTSGYASNDSSSSKTRGTHLERRPSITGADRVAVANLSSPQCPVDTDKSSLSDRRGSTETSTQECYKSAPLAAKQSTSNAECPLNGKAPSQQSKRKRKQRKTLKSLKLRRGSNSSLVSRRRSSRRKREMSQLNKSWLAVSGNLEELGMDMFRRVADLCPDITRTISGLPEGTPISSHLLLSHPRARQHAKRVMETVGMVVDSYSEFDRVRPLLVMLGRHHAKYGVEERQLMMIGEALICTLQDHLEEEWTATLADTWASLYAMIYGALLEGIKQRQAPAASLERGHHLRASFRQAQSNSLTSPATSSRSSPTGNTRKPGLSRKLSRRSTSGSNKNTIIVQERKVSV